MIVKHSATELHPSLERLFLSFSFLILFSGHISLSGKPSGHLFTMAQHPSTPRAGDR
jgi:hypothetical protein